MTRTAYLAASVLAAAACLLIGLALRKPEAVPARWVEPDDGLEPDPWLSSLLDVPTDPSLAMHYWLEPDPDRCWPGCEHPKRKSWTAP
jgi:hypothetical protein